jgi:cytoskeletal protein CcmA (bactofilin family)
MKKVYKVLFTVILAMCMMAVIATPVLALDARTGQTVTVPAGETVEGDLYVAGSSIVIDGTVNGDVFAAGQTLTINGKVNGGVSLAGQTIILNGDVSNGARIAGQSITINSNIGRDLVVFGTDLSISSKSVINGDLMLGINNANINAFIKGNIKGGGTDITISNAVGGSVELKVNNLTLVSGAKIQGDMTYTAKKLVEIQSGASVLGTTTHKQPEPRKSALPVLAGISIVWHILGFVMILIIGIILILLASGKTNEMSNAIKEKPWQSLVWGAVILCLTPIAAIIVMITVIGLPLGLITLALYLIALYLSQIPVALLLGRLIIRQNRELDSKGLMIGALALGLFILLILRAIPFIGWIIGLLIVLFGMGTLVTMMRKKLETVKGQVPTPNYAPDA